MWNCRWKRKSTANIVLRRADGNVRAFVFQVLLQRRPMGRQRYASNDRPQAGGYCTDEPSCKLNRGGR
jgi:hypothetical protein